MRTIQPKRCVFALFLRTAFTDAFCQVLCLGCSNVLCNPQELGLIIYIFFVSKIYEYMVRFFLAFTQALAPCV